MTQTHRTWAIGLLLIFTAAALSWGRPAAVAAPAGPERARPTDVRICHDANGATITWTQRSAANLVELARASGGQLVIGEGIPHTIPGQVIIYHDRTMPRVGATDEYRLYEWRVDDPAGAWLDTYSLGHSIGFCHRAYFPIFDR